MKLAGVVLVSLGHLVASALGSKVLLPSSTLVPKKAFQVHKDFLNPEEVAQLTEKLNEVEVSSPCGDVGRLQGSIVSGISSDFADRVQRTLGSSSSSSSIKTNDDKALPVSVLTKSSKPHQDRSQDTGELVDDSLVGYLVASVASKSKDPAYFHYNAEMHPLEPGSLFVFDGTAPHFTTIDEGTVTLVGPVRLDTFEPVGGILTGGQNCPRSNEDCLCLPSGIDACSNNIRRLEDPDDPPLGPEDPFLIFQRLVHSSRVSIMLVRRLAISLLQW